MAFLVRIFRLLFWLLIVSWTASILRRIVGRMGQAATPGEDTPSDAASQKLVRDPVCGVHVAEGLALPFSEGTETVYFCSAECRDRYLRGSKKFAANS